LADRENLQGIAGAYVADPEPLRQAIAVIAAEPADTRRAWRLSPNLSRQSGITIHQLSMTTPADESMLRAFGPQLMLFFGFTEHQLLLACGPNGAELIAAALQQQTSQRPTSVLPFHAQCAVAPTVGFYQRVSDDPRAARMLQSTSEQDRLTIRATPLDDGARFSVEADQGVLQTVGLALVPSFGSSSKRHP
jgi:hypothetical protein